MSSLLSAELSATCNALGTYNKRSGKYLIDDYTLNTVKDLIRYLRRDGEEHEIRRHFGQTKVLQTDLIPMLIDHWEQPELFDVTLRLLVNLTNPALLLYREEVPTERTAHHNYLQILTHLQFYKEEAFTKVETWTVFAKKLAKILEIDWTERDEDTGLIIERILILIRNVLHVPADLDRERRPENDASVHDQVLWSLNQSGILDIILYMSSENEKQYFMHIVEIISHLLREQNPTSLADAALQRSVDEKLRDEQELLVMRANESKQRSNKVKQYSASRHSRFGGTYVMQNMKSLSDNDVICLKPLNKISSLDFSGGKKDKLVKPKNRRNVESGILERRSAFAIRLFLKEFCIEFLNSSYNPLMHYVKDVLVRARAQQNDESYYLWAIKFFMEFNRGHNFQVGLVSETMSVTQFHYVQQQMEKYYDMIKVEKKKFQPWVRRLHLALRAYKELLQTLLEMEKSSDSSVQESAKVLKSNIFYVLEYREFILSTFLGYDENKMPRSYLVDLVETVHLFLKMLEHYCKKTGLVVQKKVRKKAKSKKRKAAPASKPAPVEDTVAEWEEVRPQLAVVLGSQLYQPAPFDAASDTPLDEQREDCMKKIQRSMREYKFEDAVGTFRAAREVWPEEGIFGVAGIAEDEELTMLETIYNADLGVDISVQAVAEDQDNSENDDDEEDEEEERSTAIVETDFDFKDFALRFCHPLIISACVSLLETYESNLPHTNHCCVKMLHRVAWDAQRPSMLFQGTLFLVFQILLHNPMPQYKEIEKFAIFIIRKFTEVAAQTPKAFIELLFWKNMKECAQIQHGYDLYTDAKDKPGKGGAWAEEQEEELRRLYMENQINPQTDQDVIDWILENLIDQTRTRRGVIAKLKELGLIFKAPTKRSNKPQRDRVPLDFGEEEDDLLRSLWAQYGDSADPMGVIISRMPRNRAKHIYVDRLLELGLINDKKECRKKRQKSHRNKSNSERRNSGSDDNVSRSECSDNSDSDSDGGPTSPMATLQKKSGTKNKQASKSKREAPMLSAGEIARLLVQAVDNDLSEALKWVAESLEEVALDQEADGFDPEAEGTPLVPISAASGEAMENELFLKVLRGVGVHSPVDEQETYWRIPSTLHFETIRKRREIIIKAVNKELIIDNIEPEPEQTATSNEKDDSNDDDDDLFSNLRKFADNNDANVNQSHAKKPIKEVAKKNIVTKPVNRKRSRSIDADDNNREKMQKIDEVDEDVDNLRNDKHGENDRNGKLSSDDDDKLNGGDESDEDILSFAKRTLQTNNLPDTEDILKSVYKGGSDDSEDEIVARKPDNKRRRIVINDDSD